MPYTSQRVFCELKFDLRFIPAYVTLQTTSSYNWLDSGENQL